MVTTSLSQASDAWLNTVLDHWSRENYSEALRTIEPELKNKNPSAELFIAIMYDRGEGIPKDDVKATKYYALAAKHGNIVAQSDAGARFAEGIGTKRNYLIAYTLFSIGAEYGNKSATNNKQILSNMMEGNTQFFEAAETIIKDKQAFYELMINSLK